MVPALVIAADATGMLTGWWAARQSIHITNAEFIYGTQRYFRPFDLWYSVIKAEAFGAVVTMIPCYVGFQAKEGAEGVGRATTEAVVYASITILITNFFLTLTLTKLLAAL